jgi:peptidyl-lysine (3S)-dioxygenase / protease
VRINGKERELFIEPADKTMTMREFVEVFKKAQSVSKGVAPPPVVYIQKQNDNLRDELPILIADAATELEWAKEAFDSSPDAVNFWLGDSRSVSSLHKDHYENIYAVVCGTKCFTLFPPFDLPHLHEEEFARARYTYDNEQFGIEVLEPQEMVPWIAVDPDRPNVFRYPNYQNVCSCM